MQYITMEMQTSASGEVATQVWAFPRRNEAEAKFHSILAVAATSSLPEHACVLLQSDGMMLNRASYGHAQAEEGEDDGSVEDDLG